jgi:LacI family transcriptional regulator
MTPRRITLATLATELGLSPMAVSLALRGQPRVSESTRRRVIACAQRLGYRKDPALSALSAYRGGGTGVASVLGLVTSGPTPTAWHSPAARMMVTGAEAAAAQLGYALVPYWLNPAVPAPRHARILEHRGYGGLLVAPVPDPAAPAGIDWGTFNAVALGRSQRHRDLPYASPDHFGGMQRLFQELDTLGYRRMGLALPRATDLRTAHRWHAAALEARLRRGDVIPPWISDSWTSRAFTAWVHQHEPDVILSVGAEPQRWLRASGKRVPRDIGYVSLERLPGSHTAALDQRYEDVGAAAIALLHSRRFAAGTGLTLSGQCVLVDCLWHPGRTVRRHEI